MRGFPVVNEPSRADLLGLPRLVFRAERRARMSVWQKLLMPAMAGKFVGEGLAEFGGPVVRH